MDIVIDKELIRSSEFNPTKESTLKPIKELCVEIDKTEIVLPLFQTSTRWTLEKAIELFNFQLLGKAAVSPLSMNMIKDEKIAVTQVSFIDRKKVEDISGKLSVNDGQQRLTANYKAYKDDSEFANIVLDLAVGKFILITEGIEKYQIPVGKLYNKDNSVFFNYTSNNEFLKDGEVTNILLQVRSKFFNYLYTVNIAKDLTEAQQIDWFEVLNLAGSRVPQIQLKFAKLLLEGIDIYVQYTDKFRECLKGYGLDLFGQKDTEFSIPIAALNPAYEIIMDRNHVANYSPIPSDTKEGKLCKMKSKDLIKCFDITLKALSDVLAFIDKNNLQKPSRIDYITYMIGLFVYMKDTELSEIQKNLLIKWYSDISFTNKTNQERRKMFEEILKIKLER